MNHKACSSSSGSSTRSQDSLLGASRSRRTSGRSANFERELGLCSRRKEDQAGSALITRPRGCFWVRPLDVVSNEGLHWLGCLQNHTLVVLHRTFHGCGKKPDEWEVLVEAKQPIEPLLDVSQVAEILRCSRAQVYAMVAEGSLSKVPLPYRATRFTREAVFRLIRGEVA